MSDTMLTFKPIQPIRAVNTRHGYPVPANVPHVYRLDPETFPADTAAVSMNVVAVGATEAGFITVWPNGNPRPDTSIINFKGDGGAYNGAILVGVKDLAFQVETSASCHLICDISGYWNPELLVEPEPEPEPKSEPEPAPEPEPEPAPEPKPEPEPTADFPSAELMAYDMFGAPYRTDGYVRKGVTVGASPWGKHELTPLRLNTSFDWYHGARFGQSPPWESRWISPWGQIFIGEGNLTSKVRLQVRNAHTLYLGPDNIWRDLRGDVSNWKMEGAYVDTFFNGVGLSASIRNEENNGGGWSVSLAPLVNTPKAATWHWWLNGYYPRTPIPTGTKAFLVAQQMRIITDGPDGGDPASDSTRFIASFGADSYSSPTEGTPPITGFTTPRMKRIRDQWIWVTGHSFVSWFANNSFGPSNILANPPKSWPT